MPDRTDGAPALRRRILLVDDQRVNRMILRSMLAKSFVIIEAENGAEAVGLALAGAADLVLMDIQMPVMDGYEATRTIKKALGERFLPIVLMTANDDEQALAAALDAGGDEILTKPLSPLMVERRLNALLRFADLFREVRTQRDELEHFRESAERDYALAGRIFDSVQQQGFLFLPSLQVICTPMEAFSGDLVMATLVAPSKIRVFLGDFTGHGLAPAVGVIPVAEVFYATAKAEVPMDLVLAEMNERVRATLPRSMFLAAFMAELDANTGRLLTWNGGLPTAFVLGEAGGIRRRMESAGVPLGILGREEFCVELQRSTLEVGERLFVYSDGVIEAADREGELFGNARLEAAVAEPPREGFAKESVEAALVHFHKGAPQRDDISVVELRRDASLARDIRRLVDKGSVVTSEPLLRLSMSFEDKALRAEDPLAPMRGLLHQHPLLAADCTYVDSVLSELFNNALDHGVLGLESRLKEGPDGFATFHAARARALAEMRAARITVSVEVAPEARPEIVVRVQDSGAGFRPGEPLQPLAPDDLRPYGRGLVIVQGLCNRLEFFDMGRAVRATLPFRGSLPKRESRSYPVLPLPAGYSS